MSKGLKIEHDKYYTPYHVVKEVVNTVKGLDLPISNIIEPSAGNGAFIEALSNAFPTTEVDYYDLHPEHNLIKEQNFLALDVPYQKDRLIIGNPPFGNRNSLSVKFYKKAITLGDYIAFILPISQLDNTKQMYEFDLFYSKDLGVNKYSDVDLHCCFNIYKRPENGLNGKPKAPTIEGLTVVEYRRDKEDSYRKKVKDGYFHSIGSWGNGSVGITPKHIGYYSMELYFYSDNQKIIDVVMSIDWRDEVKSISGKKLPKGLALEIIQSKLSTVMGEVEWRSQ